MCIVFQHAEFKFHRCSWIWENQVCIHTVLWQLYIENQKHVPNFWIYIWCIFARQTTFHLEDVKTDVLLCKSSLSKMASVKTNKIKNQTSLWKTNFLRYTTLFLGPKRFVNSKGPKIALCLRYAWLSLYIERRMCSVQYRFWAILNIDKGQF